MGHSYRKGIVLSVGLISTTVDLFTVMENPRTDLRRLCPDHLEPLGQRLVCPVGDHEVTYNNHVSGMKMANGYQVVNPLERPSDPPAESLGFVPVPRKEMVANAIYGNGFYYAQPSSEGSNTTWTILHKLTTEFSFLSKGALRKGSPKIWSLEQFRDYLVLKEVTFPDLIKLPPEKTLVKVDKPTMDMAKQYAQTVVSSWDQVDKHNVGLERFSEWVNSGTFTAVERERAESSGPTISLIEALRKAVENNV